VVVGVVRAGAWVVRRREVGLPSGEQRATEWRMDGGSLRLPRGATGDGLSTALPLPRSRRPRPGAPPPASPVQAGGACPMLGGGLAFRSRAGAWVVRRREVGLPAGEQRATEWRMKGGSLRLPRGATGGGLRTALPLPRSRRPRPGAPPPASPLRRPDEGVEAGFVLRNRLLGGAGEYRPMFPTGGAWRKRPPFADGRGAVSSGAGWPGDRLHLLVGVS